MATLTDESSPSAEFPITRSRRARFRSWWRRRPVKKATIWTHRWAALVLGVLLVLVCTTGVPLLYTKEITQLTNAAAYDAAGPASLSLAEARESMRQHDPDFVPQSIWLTDDVYVGMNYDDGRNVTVDGNNGEILGDFSVKEGTVATTMNFLVNFHDCLLACEDYPGYQAWLNKPVPGTGWLGGEEGPMTWAALLLGILGLVLLFLALTGVWLWWPGVRRWIEGVRVRWRKGRYARDFDLHQVAGMIALPLLLVWAVTAMGFEFNFVVKAWYQVLPGEERIAETFESNESSAPDLDIATAEKAAVAEARRVEPDVAGPSGVDLPAIDDPVGTFGFWFQKDFDPYGLNQYPGNMSVNVDRHDASRTAVTYGSPEEGAAQTVINDYFFTTHAGWLVGPWWRLIWAVLGLVPLLLAITGLSTWLYTRRVRKRRRSIKAAAASGPPA